MSDPPQAEHEGEDPAWLADLDDYTLRALIRDEDEDPETVTAARRVMQRRIEGEVLEEMAELHAEGSFRQMTTNSLVRRLGRNRDDVRGAIARLVAQGLIHRLGGRARGFWLRSAADDPSGVPE